VPGGGVTGFCEVGGGSGVCGRTDGKGAEQDVKGHAGGKSVALSHTGRNRPSLHWHEQADHAGAVDRMPINAAKMIVRMAMAPPSG
jgi:hypothetical protein